MNNEQTEFWKGQFGNYYTARNINLVENNYQMFKNIFYSNTIEIGQLNRNNKVIYDNFIKGTRIDINSIIEFGAGSGQNIQALQKIFPNAGYYAIEINKNAVSELKKINKLCVIEGSMFDYFFDFSITGKVKADLVLSKGLLIRKK